MMLKLNFTNVKRYTAQLSTDRTARLLSHCMLSEWATRQTLTQRFSNFFDYGPLFSSGIVGGPPHLLQQNLLQNNQILGHTAFYKQTNIINYIQITVEGKQCQCDGCACFALHRLSILGVMLDKNCANNDYFSESSRGPLGTRRGPPLVSGPQFENRCCNRTIKTISTISTLYRVCTLRINQSQL